MPEIEWDGEELPRLSPGVGCDSTAQGDKVTMGKHQTVHLARCRLAVSWHERKCDCCLHFSKRQVVSGLKPTSELRTNYAKYLINAQNIKSTQVKSKITLN